MPDPSHPERPTTVAIALVARDGRYLVRQRPAESALGGYWEFPGGKCEPGETPADAARRECLEETGLEVVIGALRQRVIHQYSHACVELSFFDAQIRNARAEPIPEAGFTWIAAEDLCGLRFPDTNRSVLEALAREHSETVGRSRFQPRRGDR
jgi:mutator protein MutT